MQTHKKIFVLFTLMVAVVVVSCNKNKNNGDDETTETHTYVDLGLPSGTLWATCNVGANTTEEYGSYFAWGETQPKNVYSWGTYAHANGTYEQLTKYCSDPLYGFNGFTDSLTILQPSDDAATANWGNKWSIPTRKQWRELNSNTTRELVTQNGVSGIRFTSDNGNTLFLPAAGVMNGGDLFRGGEIGHYWTDTINSDDQKGAWHFAFGTEYIMMDCNNTYPRILGFSVRPVFTPQK